tara:strand:+ start:242 stop:544 length:303 start_codon:yes stop_codon:yes gene_type:complete
MAKLKINNLMNDKDIAWKKITCKCDKSDIEKCFPIFKDCIHCKCQAQQDSMPREQFTMTYNEMDKNKQPTGKLLSKTIKEITIDRSVDGYNSIRGWSYHG